MPDDLRPATRDEIRDSLMYALRFDGRRPHRHAAEIGAHVLAKIVIEHLEQCGFVVMKKPDARAISAPTGKCFSRAPKVI